MALTPVKPAQYNQGHGNTIQVFDTEYPMPPWDFSTRPFFADPSYRRAILSSKAGCISRLAVAAILVVLAVILLDQIGNQRFGIATGVIVLLIFVAVLLFRQKGSAETVASKALDVELTIYTAMLERARRGFSVLTPGGGLIRPEVDDNGYPIIEETDEVYGTPVRIICKGYKLPKYDSGLARYASSTNTEKPLTPLDQAYLSTVLNELEKWRGRGLYPIATSNTKAMGTIDNILPVCEPLLEEVPMTASLLGRAVNPYAPPSDIHGSAQFAWIDELQTKGLVGTELERETGTLLGRAIYLGPDGKPDRLNHLVWHRSEGHRLLVGPPGAGKFTAGIAPLLLTTNAASVFVFDVKNGEATELSAAWRRKKGQYVGVLDPFSRTTLPTEAINPLDLLVNDTPLILERAKRLADAIYIPTSSTDQFFDQTAQNLLASLLIHVATSPVESNNRTLSRVRQIIRQDLRADVLFAMKDNPTAGGTVREAAESILDLTKRGMERTHLSVLVTLKTNTEFLDLPTVRRVTDRTTFQPEQLRQRPTSLFVVVPEHETRVINRWLRLVYTTVMERLRDATGSTPIHVIMDEFPALGRFDRVADDMARVRSLSIHHHIVVQNLPQLREHYGDAWERFMALSKVRQILGANDTFTAKEFSQLFGTTTRAAVSTSKTRSLDGAGRSQTKTYVGRPLLAPDELTVKPEDDAYVAIEGCNPIKLKKQHYYEMSILLQRASRPR